MHIKIPKRNKVMTKISEVISGIKLKYNKITTKKGQIVRTIIILIILLSLTIALMMLITSIKQTETYSAPDNTKSKYLDEKNSSKIKDTYNSSERKEQFILLATDIELKVVSQYMNTTNQKEFNLVIENLNKEFKKSEWKSIGITQPKEWIGEWSVDKTGAFKFKFLNKQMEPDWINDAGVSKYIIKN